MKKNKRVVVTGMGIISPIGNSIDEFWQNVMVGNHGFVYNDRVDVSEHQSKYAALVKNFKATDYMTFKQAQRMELFSAYAVSAAKQAVASSGLDLTSVDPERCGVSIGSGIGGLATIENETIKINNGGANMIATLYVPFVISNMASANVAIHFGFKGNCINPVVACASGTYAIGDAYRAILNGNVDVMIAGGTEAAITPTSLAGFAKLHTLSEADDPDRAMIPFDKDREGFVIGEGAGIVTLEDYDYAVSRGANILAEIVGYGVTCDAHHIVTPKENGEGIAKAMRLAIKEAGINEYDVEYINAHGTATVLNDLCETRAIKDVFREHAHSLYINSTKSMTGHMIGASGAVEFITTVKQIQEGFIHKTVGLQNPDEELGLNYMQEAKSAVDINYALSNSMGFGGHNGSILIKRFVLE